MAKSFTDIIKEIEENYNYHKAEADNYKRLLDAVKNGEPVPERKFMREVTHRIVKVRGLSGVNPKPTFEDEIVDFMQDGKPKTTRELIARYKEKTGKEYSSKNFSSKLSIASNHKRFQNAIYPEFPLEMRYWWGLSSWFDGKKFKKAYDEIVREKAVSQMIMF